MCPRAPISMRTSTRPSPAGSSSRSNRVERPSSFLTIWAARVATVSGDPRTVGVSVPVVKASWVSAVRSGEPKTSGAAESSRAALSSGLAAGNGGASARPSGMEPPLRDGRTALAVGAASLPERASSAALDRSVRSGRAEARPSRDCGPATWAAAARLGAASARSLCAGRSVAGVGTSAGKSATGGLGSCGALDPGAGCAVAAFFGPAEAGSSVGTLRVSAGCASIGRCGSATTWPSTCSVRS